MLTTEQSTLLALIRSALWGTDPPENKDIAMPEARRQALVPLLFPDSLEAMTYSAHYIRILHAQDELIAMMNEAAIPMVILKGSAAAMYYPDPFQRTMGDIDFIVPQDLFQKASDLMDENGYHLTHDLNDTARHRCFTRDGLSFELHHHYSFDGIDVERYIADGLKYPSVITIEGHDIPVLPSLKNGMVLLAHVANHLRSELGLRQVIDWMMFVNAVLEDELWNSRFQAAAADCGLETLAVVMTKMCQMYLGLSNQIHWCDGADERLATELLENLLTTGNFGHSLGSGSSVEMVTTNIKRHGLFRFLQIAGEHNWKAYHKHRWLKPFCWLYQIFRYAKQGLKAGRNKEQIVDDLNRSQARYDLLTRLDID